MKFLKKTKKYLQKAATTERNTKRNTSSVENNLPVVGTSRRNTQPRYKQQQQRPYRLP
jgi:hypothetical protein